MIEGNVSQGQACLVMGDFNSQSPKTYYHPSMVGTRRVLEREDLERDASGKLESCFDFLGWAETKIDDKGGTTMTGQAKKEKDSTDAKDIMAERGEKDSTSFGAGLRHAWEMAGVLPPAHTHWSGKTIDQALCGPLWDPNLCVLGTYVVHTDASDHLPLVVDLGLLT